MPDGSTGGVDAGAFNERVDAVAAAVTPVTIAGKADTEMGRTPTTELVGGDPNSSVVGGCNGNLVGGGGSREHFDFVFVGFADSDDDLASSSSSSSSLLSQSLSSSPLFLNSRSRSCRMLSIFLCVYVVTVRAANLGAASPLSFSENRESIPSNSIAIESGDVR